MALSIKPISCNGGCRSCYEEDIRKIGKSFNLDIPRILDIIEIEGKKPAGERSHQPSLHGGEPLLYPIPTLAALLDKIHEYWGSSSIQTNGILLKNEHVDLFKKYKTNVGVSLDGDTGELNYGRWNKGNTDVYFSEKKTNETLENIKKLKYAGVKVSVISVLRSYNASAKRLEKFIKFLFRLQTEFDITSVRTNPGIVFDDKFKDEELAPMDMGHALMNISEFCLADANRMWQPARDMVNLIMGHSDATCVFKGCDPWKTNSETPIREDGMLGNCLKSAAARDGLFIMRDEESTNIRSEILSKIPFENGGCSPCNYWPICKGGCPGEGIDNDWRNKTRFCLSFIMAFSHIERKIKGMFPNIRLFSDFDGNFVDKKILMSIEKGTWEENKKISISGINDKFNIVNGSIDEGKNCSQNTHGDRPHGDKPHGDR